MSTKIVSYKEVKCDICGKTEDIKDREQLPTDWKYVNVGISSYDACEECSTKIYNYIQSLKEENNEQEPEQDSDEF